MFIIGTSGHIDHGKTSLIRALTGIDCDRLPEEKQREMTIDIGFANIEYPKFGTVSIIDVPGHERFIRNMVAGAWGIDLALLVVAADDGWMPQTEDHFRVLELLGIERIIAVINKIDMVDDETIELVTADIAEHLAGTRYADADLARVSARTGAGVDELKQLILQNLGKLPKAGDAGRPYLYVDRVFTSKGYGTIVTGTLKNGRFHEEDEVTVLPQRRAVRIKKIESHFQALAEGTPSQRTALNLAGIAREEIERGAIVARDNFFAESGDILTRLRILGERRIKNNIGIKVLIGTTTRKAKLILAHEPDDGSRTVIARIKFDEPWFFYPGQPFVVTHPGGHRIIGGGFVVLTEYGGLRNMRALRAKVGALAGFGREDLIAFSVAVRGAVPRADVINSLPDNPKAIEKIITTLINEKRITAQGPLLVDPAYGAASMAAIRDAVMGAVGLNLKEIADRCGIDPEFCRLLMPAVAAEHGIVDKDGRYYAGNAVTPDTLSPDRKKVLDDVRAKGREGMELDKADDAAKGRIRELVKLGFLVSLDGSIIFHREVYDELKRLVLAEFDRRDKLTVPEAKDATGLSRKYIIPLLNRIETDGAIKRIGDFRIKA